MKLCDFSAFIFDMDGLVLDTEPGYFAAWQQAIQTLGFSVDDGVHQKLTGQHYSQIQAYLRGRYGEGFDLAAFHRHSVLHWRQHIRASGIPVKNGVRELLAFAESQTIPVCLATNSETEYADECLEVAGMLAHFPLRITAGDVRKVKPAPDIFLKAAERMAVDIKSCLIFEDSPAGVRAAVDAGACTVYVPSVLPAAPSAVEMADYVLDDLGQAFEII